MATLHPLELQFASNELLARLPPHARDAVAAEGKQVELTQGATLHRFGEATTAFVFPLSGMVSLTVPTPERQMVEVALVGRHGAVVVRRLLGLDRGDLEAIVQVQGEAVEVPVRALSDRLEPSLSLLAARYAGSLIIETAQTAACNRVHTVEQRTARWLLHAGDRARTGDLELTHDFMAMMLAVRRASVTTVVGIFARAGLIDAKRGQISLADRAGLAEFACGCYEVIRASAPVYE